MLIDFHLGISFTSLICILFIPPHHPSKPNIASPLVIPSYLTHWEGKEGGGEGGKVGRGRRGGEGGEGGEAGGGREEWV